MSVPRMCREPGVRRIVGAMRRNPSASHMTCGVEARGTYGTHPPAVPDPRPPADGLAGPAGTTPLGRVLGVRPDEHFGAWMNWGSVL